MATFARRDQKTQAGLGKALIVETQPDGGIRALVDNNPDGNPIEANKVTLHPVGLTGEDAQALTGWLIDHGYAPEHAVTYDEVAADAKVVDSDAYRTARNRINRAVNQMPYGGLVHTRHPGHPGHATDTAVKLLDDVADYMEALGEVLRRYASERDYLQRELDTLRGQQRAVREFLGINTGKTEEPVSIER